MFFLNLVRVLLLLWVMASIPQHIDVFHYQVGQGIMVLFVLVFWIHFRRRASGDRARLWTQKLPAHLVALNDLSVLLRDRHASSCRVFAPWYEVVTVDTLPPGRRPTSTPSGPAASAPSASGSG